MSAPMPSPLGHTLAGLAVGWLSEPASIRGDRSRRPATLTPFVLWCALIAAVPDADLLVPHFHRSATHSLTATAFILIMAMAVTGRVTAWRAAFTFAFALAAAHATHLVLDWLGTDRFPPLGIQMLWPFSDRFYISGFDIFPPVERRLLRPDAFSINARAAAWELIILGPFAAVGWIIRMKRQRTIEPLTMTSSEARPR
jgi:inner membrane protein